MLQLPSAFHLAREAFLMQFNAARRTAGLEIPGGVRMPGVGAAHGGAARGPMLALPAPVDDPRDKG